MAFGVRPLLQGAERSLAFSFVGRCGPATHRRLAFSASRLRTAPCGVCRAGAEQPQQVQRPARFRPGARQPFATKRLHTHHGADDVAVGVDIARVRRAHHLRQRLVDTRVHAQRQAVAGVFDLLQ